MVFMRSIFVLLIALVPLTASAQVALEHGPYLQSLDDDGVVVRWRTDGDEDSYVRYGAAWGDLDQTESTAGLTSEHEITLSGLDPDTTYYYSVGDIDTEHTTPGPLYFWHTAPTTGTSTPFTIWAMADTGFGTAGPQAAYDGFLSYMAGETAEVWLIAGDVAYADGEDAEFSVKHFSFYEPTVFHSPVWPSPGAHDAQCCAVDPDYRVDPDVGPYFDLFTLPDASGSEAYYSYDYGNTHFVSVTTTPSTGRWTNQEIADWLTTDLAGTSAEWIIVYMYHASYSKGSHDSDSPTSVMRVLTREILGPIMEDAGVDLVLGGHSHIFERSMFLSGHYGVSTTFSEQQHAVNAGDGDPDGDGVYKKQQGCTNCGTVYATIGSGGWNKVDKIGLHPAHVISLDGSELPATGSATGQATMVINIDGLRLDGRMIDENGDVVDHFTIMKSAEWSSNTIGLRGGANYIPDADTSSPTLSTGQCKELTVSCWGTTLSSLMQVCNGPYLYADDLDTSQCQDLDQIAIDCAAQHTVQIDPAPEFIRMRSGDNYGGGQYFRAFCNGTK